MKNLRFTEAEYQAFLSQRPHKLNSDSTAYEGFKTPLDRPGIIRQSKRGPNSTEKRFELEYLIPMLASGEINQYRFEAIRLKLANGHTYRCEWTAVNAAGKLVFWEVKGGRERQREAGIIQIKVAATSYPEFEFWLCRWKAGNWTIQKVLP